MITTPLTTNSNLIYCISAMRSQMEAGFPIEKFTFVNNGYQYAVKRFDGFNGFATQFSCSIEPYPFLGVGRTTFGISTTYAIEIGNP